MVKTDVKKVFWRVFAIVGFVITTESCQLCSEFLTGLCYAKKLHADGFWNSFEFVQIEPARCDFVLSLQNTRISLNQKPYGLLHS